MATQDARECKQSRLFEPELRAAADGLCLTVRVDIVGLGATRERRFFVIDPLGRRLRISPEFIHMISSSRLRAVLAIFSEGASAITFSDGRILELLIEPETTEGERG